MLWVGKNISVDNKGMYVSGRFQHWQLLMSMIVCYSLVPRPPPFLPSVCVFTMFTIHGSGKAVKNGESLSSFIAWMTSGKVDVRGDQARWMYERIRQGGCTRGSGKVDVRGDQARWMYEGGAQLQKQCTSSSCLLQFWTPDVSVVDTTCLHQ